jgi:periplasmic copper chaperone A
MFDSLRKTVLLVASSALVFTPLLAQEHEHVATAGDIRIVHAWARAAAAGSDTLVFMDIENKGTADRLLSAETSKAEKAEIAGITMRDGNTTTTPLGVVDIGSGETMLDPGGMAIVLHGLTGDLVKGEDFDLTVRFEKAGAVELDVEIEAADATQHSHAGHAH